VAISASAGLVDPSSTLSDHLLHAVLLLLHREVADHGRQLPHYFSLFHNYAMQGLVEKAQLLKVCLKLTPFNLVSLIELFCS
jgi:ubiquitin carboxyl-terminal hydrolase 9/24